MNILLYALIVFLSYLLGCSNMALYVSKLKGVDIRSAGYRNLGASNAMVLMGWRFGVLVGIHDIGKAVLAVVLARHFGGELPFISAAAGVACVLAGAHSVEQLRESAAYEEASDEEKDYAAAFAAFPKRTRLP